MKTHINQDAVRHMKQHYGIDMEITTFLKPGKQPKQSRIYGYGDDLNVEYGCFSTNDGFYGANFEDIPFEWEEE